jgi:hypothetical protein
MFAWMLYLLIRRLVRLLLRAGEPEQAAKLEVLVLRHQPSVSGARGSGRGSGRGIERSWLRSAGCCLGSDGTRSSCDRRPCSGGIGVSSSGSGPGGTDRRADRRSTSRSACWCCASPRPSVGLLAHPRGTHAPHHRDAIAGLRPSARCSCPARSLDPTRGLTAGVPCKGHERPRAGFGLPARTQGSGPGAAQGQSGRVRSDRQPLARQGTASAWARVGDAPALTLRPDASSQGWETRGLPRGRQEREGRRGGHDDSRPHRWPARTLRPGAGSAPALRCGSAGAAPRGRAFGSFHGIRSKRCGASPSPARHEGAEAQTTPEHPCGGIPSARESGPGTI